MTSSSDRRTIFLATDGRHLTVACGDAPGLVPEALAAIRAWGEPGWLTTVNNRRLSYPRLSLVHAIDGADAGGWERAVGAFYARRADVTREAWAGA